MQGMFRSAAIGLLMFALTFVAALLYVVFFVVLRGLCGYSVFVPSWLNS